MGDVIQFTGKRLSGFVPERDPDYPNLPKPFCESYKSVRNELAALIPPDNPIYDKVIYCSPPIKDTSPSEYSAPSDDCA